MPTAANSDARGEATVRARKYAGNSDSVIVTTPMYFTTVYASVVEVIAQAGAISQV